MNKNKIDLRVTKTKDALKSSFVDLIKRTTKGGRK